MRAPSETLARGGARGRERRRPAADRARGGTGTAAAVAGAVDIALAGACVTQPSGLADCPDGLVADPDTGLCVEELEPEPEPLPSGIDLLAEVSDLDVVRPPPRCGDGLKDLAESCDDGNVADGDGCNKFCVSETCGNLILDGNEACDVGMTPSACCTACGIAVDCTCTSSPNLNTGSNPLDAELLAVGASDLIWSWSDPVTQQKGQAIVSANCAPGAWIDPPATSSWLTRYGCQLNTPENTETHYTATFTIPNAAVAAGTVIAGTIWADNYIADVLVNGTVTGLRTQDEMGYTGPGVSFGDWPSSLYVAGINTITVVVHNSAGTQLNPDGLLVSIPGAFTGSVCTPKSP